MATQTYQVAQLPDDEAERLEALRSFNILDTPPEETFDRIVKLASSIFKLPIAVVSLVDANRQWFKAICGLDATETGRDVAFCAHAILSNDVCVVPDARCDDRFAGNPLVTGGPAIRFYAGAPLLTSAGHKLGTLCVIDTVPHHDFDAEKRMQLGALAAIVVDELRLRRKKAWLRNEVLKATYVISDREKELIFRLTKASECRDPETGNHIARISQISKLIALKMGLSEEGSELVLRAAPMHDIGKVGIPDHILLKPDGLTPDEVAIMRTHPTIGHRILGGSESPLVRFGAEIALCHHEMFDGSGYPRGLAGEDIPLAARIVAVTDVFDALMSDRPYKKAWSPEDSRAYIQQKSGTHFDARCVQAFLEQWPNILKVRAAHDDGHANADAPFIFTGPGPLFVPGPPTIVVPSAAA